MFNYKFIKQLINYKNQNHKPKMSEKILSEFAVRLNKSRTQLQDVCNQVESLRKESTKLQHELDSANEEKVAAEREQDQLSS